MSTSDNDIVRRGYLNVVRNPQGGVVSTITNKHVCLFLCNVSECIYLRTIQYYNAPT